jgi:hypothetical protein
MRNVDAKTLAQNILHDLKSLRALWNYIFLLIYLWVVAYLVLYHAETCGNTVVMTTGGLVGTIFTGYVFSTHMDRRIDAATPKPCADAAYAAEAGGFPQEAPGDDNG